MRKVIELFEILTHTAVNIRRFRQWCGVYCLVQLHFNSVYKYTVLPFKDERGPWWPSYWIKQVLASNHRLSPLFVGLTPTTDNAENLSQYDPGLLNKKPNFEFEFFIHLKSKPSI